MKIEKTEYSYHVTECDLKFGEQITLDDVLLIPASVLDKIQAEIEKQKECHCVDAYVAGLNYAIDMIDKYKAKPKDIEAEAQATDFLAEARSCGED